MPKGSNKADKAYPGKLLDEERARHSKKQRIMFMLIAAKKNDTWLTIRDFEQIASRGYVYALLAEFKKNGWTKERQIPVRMIVDGIKRVTRLTGWQGTNNLVSFVSSQKEGPPPRYITLRQKRRVKDVEDREITVLTRPASELIGVDYARTEELKVWVQLDPAVAAALRKKMTPPRTEDDKAEQYVMHTEAFALTISAKDKARFDLYTLEWGEILAQLCIISGLSKRAIKSLISMVNHAIPEGFAKVEFPLFLQQLNDLKTKYHMRTEIKDEKGKSIGFIVESWINRSMTIDFEVLGKVYAVDTFLSTMSAMQHNAAVNYASIKHKALQEAEEREREQKEAETAMTYCSCGQTVPIMVAGRMICQNCGDLLNREQLEQTEEDKEKDESWKDALG